jgi:hypothetical protein
MQTNTMNVMFAIFKGDFMNLRTYIRNTPKITANFE